MTRGEFIRALEQGGITFSYSERGERIVIAEENYYFKSGDLGITSIPSNVTFENSGTIRLDGISQLPEGLFFNNYGGVLAEEITRIPRGTKFGKGVKTVLIKSGNIYFHNIDGINYGDLLTATFKYL
jgi:hypothetical protein